MEKENAASTAESFSGLQESLCKLRRENAELKSELELSKCKVRFLLKGRNRMKSLETLIKEKEAEVDFCRKQLSELLRKNSGEEQEATACTSSDETTPALHATTARLLKDNLRLRKELLGVTPERTADSPVGKCRRCAMLQRQKDRQALYFESKLLQYRRLERKYQLTLRVLEEHVQELKEKIEQLEKSYQEKVEKLEFRSKVFEDRNSKLEQFNRLQMKGIETSIQAVKSKIEEIERLQLKEQCRKLGALNTKEALAEIRKLNEQCRNTASEIKQLCKYSPS